MELLLKECRKGYKGSRKHLYIGVARMNRRQQTNRFYKTGFFIVLTILMIILSILLIGAIRLFGNVDSDLRERPTTNSENEELLSFQMTLDQSNLLLDNLLEEDIPFYFYLAEDGVYLEGEVDAVLSSIDVAMRFEPTVQEDGSLLLEADNLSAGFLSISPETALRMFNQIAELPEWIYLYPSEEHVVIDLRMIEELEPFGLRFNDVNLSEDVLDISLIQ